MNLLPRTRDEFGQTEYWNTFFKKRGEQAFEWWAIKFIQRIKFCLSLISLYICLFFD